MIESNFLFCPIRNPAMDCLNYNDKYDCPPIKDISLEPNYDTSIDAFRGIIYSVVLSALFWIGIIFLIKWLF